MPEDLTPAQRPLSAATTMSAGAPAGTAAAPAGAGSVAGPARTWLRGRDGLRRAGARVRVGPVTGRIALAVIVVLTFLVVFEATAGPSILVPRSNKLFPSWEAGPLHDVATRLILNPRTLGQAFTIALLVMFGAYGLVLLGLRSLSLRSLAVVIVLVHVIVLLSPPLQLTDTFNYLGYARLGGLHHLNPYSHVINNELYDPVSSLASWHNLKSPYGELFTMLSYLVAFLPLPVAYWVLKLAVIALSLTFLWLVALCAKRLGRDPRYAVAFVAFNPVFIIYAIGGFHNDFFMLVPSMASVALVLGGRDRSAGASLMVAVAVKFTAILLGPFLLLAVVTRPRQKRLITGGVAMLVPLLVLSLVFFGTALPNLSQQSTLLTNFSIPNLVGLIGGVGGTHLLLKLADVIVVGVLAYHFLVRRSHWLSAAGWVTFALILSLSWAVPWYVIWVLPLAALGPSVPLRRWTIALSLFLTLAFVPVTSQYLADHHIALLGTPAGHASRALQNQLSG